VINYECYQIRQERDRSKYFTVLNELGDCKLNGAGVFKVSDETESKLEELMTMRRDKDEDVCVCACVRQTHSGFV
jgi:hypothetical protein